MLLAFSCRDKDAKCTEQTHTSPTQITNSSFRVKKKPTRRAKNKNDFKRMVALENRARIEEKWRRELFLFLISPSIIFAILLSLLFWRKLLF